jgi:DNA-binding transcriptional LysR family regulator
MEFEDIRTFVAIADTGSISHAARELYLTQPAVTRRLQRLETSLGTTLLDRRRRPFVLTQNGRSVLERCRRVLSSVHDVQAASVAGGVPAGELRIGVAHALTEITLTDPLDRVRSTFPRVNLRLTTGWSRGLLAQVRSAALDAAIVLLPQGEDLPSAVRATQIAAEQLLVVQSRLTKSPRIRELRELQGASWILNPEGCGARAALERALLRANVNMTVTLETYNYDLQLQLVAKNRGFSLVPSRVLNRSRLRSRVTALEIPGLRFPWTIWSVQGQLSGGLDAVVKELDGQLIQSLKDSKHTMK